MWFDEPNAKDRVSAIANDADGVACLNQWIDNGYFIVDDIASATDIDDLLADVADIWDTDTPRELTINRLQMNGQFRPSVPHAEILALPKAERHAIRSASNYTLGDIHPASEPVRRIFESQRVKDICSLILNAPAEPRNTLYFDKGSQQGIHQDAGVFHVFPQHSFVGVWIALEDIGPDCGPLVYYPGSHKEPMWSEFPNYPQTNLRTIPQEDPEKFKRYDDHLAEVAKRYERKQALLKKGSALIWHGMLLHGGDKVNDPTLTRKSLVIHVMQQGADRQPEMVGPFQW
jgi:phytanoyl-CoA hydroxylase